jgi:hypothetical protein
VTSIVLLPAVAVGALLLILSGLAKARDPGSALAGLGRANAAPTTAAGMRAAGVAEAALGGVVLVAPTRPTAAALAGVYFLFAAVVEWQRRQPGVTSCGCLGRRSAPPSIVHTAWNLGLATAAGVAAWLGGVPSLASAWSDSAPLTAVAVAAILAATALAAAVITDLPQLLSSYHRPTAGR